jgi:aurora kinase, other
MAPESLFSKGYDHKVDVWALGIIYFQLLTGHFVFNAQDLNELGKNVRKGDWSFPKSIDFSVSGLDFLYGTLQYDSEKRLNWE